MPKMARMKEMKGGNSAVSQPKIGFAAALVIRSRAYSRNLMTQ
jgi:hypothetical protein